MEGRVNKKVNDHQYNFKTDIQDYLKKNDLSIKNRDDQELTSDFLKFIFDHGNINLSKEDFKKSIQFLRKSLYIVYRVSV